MTEKNLATKIWKKYPAYATEINLSKSLLRRNHFNNAGNSCNKTN